MSQLYYPPSRADILSIFPGTKAPWIPVEFQDSKFHDMRFNNFGSSSNWQVAGTIGLRFTAL